LTLTIKNCTSNELSGTITQILKAWNKLTKDDARGFTRAFAGTFRALEVTYNKDEDTYHPHLHVLAAVTPEYFKRRRSRYYLTQKKLRDLWAGALGVDYLPQCRIQKVESKQAKYVAEVAKYTVKTLSIPNSEVLQTFDNALRRKRLTAFGGVFKEVAMKLKIADEVKAAAEDGAADLMANPEIVKEVYGWNIGARTYTLKTVI
jgi:plasmid rolling circle replication initiator protein Rep